MTGMTTRDDAQQPMSEPMTNQTDQAHLSDCSRSSRIVKDRQPWYRQLRWGDFLMYGLITVLAVSLFLATPLRPAGQAQVAVLTEDGTILFTKPLTELQTAGSFPIEAMGYHYTIAYEGGRIRFSEADCPDKVCVRTGWISRNGQVAACVPGHLILKITGPATNGNNDVDIVMQ